MTRVLVAFLCVLTTGAAMTSCRRPSDGSSAGGSTAVSPSTGPQTVLTPGAPTPESLSQLLGVRVDAAPGEVNQYLIRAAQGSVDLSRVGKIHSDIGYAVGVTLPNGAQIGFRFETLPKP